MLGSYGLGDTVVNRCQEGSNPLPSTKVVGEWSGMVSRLTLNQDLAGSNPASPANYTVLSVNRDKYPKRVQPSQGSSPSSH